MNLGSVKITTPATIANLVCAFDIMGICLNEPYDLMELRFDTTNERIIKHIDNYNLTTDPNNNVAGVALNALLNSYPNPLGYHLTIEKKIKPGSGLGSSAASAAGAVIAANILLDNYFNQNQLIEFALAGEALASGAKHYDNIAPIIYGGITLIHETSPLKVQKLNYPSFYIAIAHPQIEIKTADARHILKKEILLKDAVKQLAKVAALVAGLEQKNYNLIKDSLHDFIIEPHRSLLIPKFWEIKAQALNLGAIGGGISGSGPALFMICDTEDIALKINTMYQTFFAEINLNVQTYISTVNQQGVKIINN